MSQLDAAPFLSCCSVTYNKQGSVHGAAVMYSTRHKTCIFELWWQCEHSPFIVCVLLLLQEYEHRVSLLSDLLLQQDSAAGEQKELIADLTQRLSTTSCEVSGLHQQGGMRMVRRSTYCLPNTCLFAHCHTDSKKNMLLLKDFGCALLWLVQK